MKENLMEQSNNCYVLWTMMINFNLLARSLICFIQIIKIKSNRHKIKQIKKKFRTNNPQ
jgi:hypothetical protein